MRWRDGSNVKRRGFVIRSARSQRSAANIVWRAPGSPVVRHLCPPPSAQGASGSRPAHEARARRQGAPWLMCVHPCRRTRPGARTWSLSETAVPARPMSRSPSDRPPVGGDFLRPKQT